MIKVGITGLGRALDFTVRYALELKGRYAVSAVYDTCAEHCGKVAAKYGAVACKSYEEMLELRDVDLVLVLTPPAFHCGCTVRALEKGKHVLVEKPMALTSAECWKMLSAAKKSGKILTVDHEQRFVGTCGYPALKKAVDAGEIGRPLFCSVSYRDNWGGYGGVPHYVNSWERKKEYGGGALLSWGPHLVDMVLNLFGSNPLSVYSVLSSRGWEYSGDSYSNLTLRYVGGVAAQIEMDYKATVRRTRFSVQGSGGMIEYSGPHPMFDGKVTLYNGQSAREIPVSGVPKTYIYEKLADAIETGCRPAVDPFDAADTIAVLEAALVSDEKNVVMPLNFLPRL